METHQRKKRGKEEVGKAEKDVRGERRKRRKRSERRTEPKPLV